MKRVMIYAAVYGSIGVALGVLMALYTQNTPPTTLFSPNHTAPSAPTPTTVTGVAPLEEAKQHE